MPPYAPNGEESGEMVMNLTPGLRWAINEDDHAGLTLSFQITGRESFDSLFIFSFIHHF